MTRVAVKPRISTIAPATPNPHEPTSHTHADDDSDYGDFGEDAEEIDIINQILTQIAATEQEDLESTPFLVTDIEDYEPPRGVRVPKVLGLENINPTFATQAQVDVEVFRDQQAQSTIRKDPSKERKPSPEPPPPVPDTRSPIERFRRPPKKALSVTDLVSPAWCELQYFYTLSKHGRKKRTVAMKQGSAVHQALEDEVHTTVPVDVTTKEDSWGLRIWNIIQGLRTLRETGRTRELEVWGTVGGEIVNGIIDELSYECPDPKYEENIKSEKDIQVELPEFQTSITDYLLSAGQKEDGQDLTDAMRPPSRKPNEKWIYITDVKTRASPTLPAGSSIRPTILQLHLYHHMLENLAQGNFHLSQLADRYDLNIQATFSDSFIAQIGGLNQDQFRAASSQAQQDGASQVVSSQDSIDILLQNNNLTSLWDFMMSQFQETFLLSSQATDPAEPPTPTPQSVSEIPPPSSQPTRLSPLLTAEYLAPTYKHMAGKPKKLLGRKSFGFNAAFLKSYLEDNLAWWRGERQAKGVELQEAWKCRSCDFRDDCEWIHERDQASVKEAMERKQMRETAGVEKKTVPSAGSRSTV